MNMWQIPNTVWMLTAKRPNNLLGSFFEKKSVTQTSVSSLLHKIIVGSVIP